MSFLPLLLNIRLSMLRFAFRAFVWVSFVIMAVWDKSLFSPCNSCLEFVLFEVESTHPLSPISAKEGELLDSICLSFMVIFPLPKVE